MIFTAFRAGTNFDENEVVLQTKDGDWFFEERTKVGCGYDIFFHFKLDSVDLSFFELQ